MSIILSMIYNIYQAQHTIVNFYENGIWKEKKLLKFAFEFLETYKLKLYKLK